MGMVRVAAQVTGLYPDDKGYLETFRRAATIGERLKILAISRGVAEKSRQIPGKLADLVAKKTGKYKTANERVALAKDLSRILKGGVKQPSYKLLFELSDALGVAGRSLAVGDLSEPRHELVSLLRYLPDEKIKLLFQTGVAMLGDKGNHFNPFPHKSD